MHTDKNEPLDKSFKKEEDKAEQKWEKVKDEISGVDRSLEKKLEEDTVDPEDLENLNG